MKRTKRLDNEREVLLYKQADGTPVWTTKGEIQMQGADNEELSHNLAVQRKANATKKIVDRVLEQAALFVEQVVTNIAPQNVLTDEVKFSEWLSGAPLKVVQDGLKTVVIYNGEELASHTAKVSESVKSDVLVALALERNWRGLL